MVLKQIEKEENDRKTLQHNCGWTCRGAAHPKPCSLHRPTSVVLFDQPRGSEGAVFLPASQSLGFPGVPPALVVFPVPSLG